MQDQAILIKTLFEKTEHYARASADLYKLKAIDKYSDVASSVITWFSIIQFATIFSLILTAGLALWINDLLGSSYYGFFIVSGVYALLGVFLYIFRNKWIKTPLRNSVITHALN